LFNIYTDIHTHISSLPVERSLFQHHIKSTIMINNIKANTALVSEKYRYRPISKVGYRDRIGSEKMWIGASL